MPDDGLDELNDMASNDAENLKREIQKYRNRDGRSVSAPAAVEWALWGLTALAGLFMLVSLFFAGPDGLLTGAQWLGFSLVGLGLCGGGAMAMRLLRGGLQ